MRVFILFFACVFFYSSSVVSFTGSVSEGRSDSVSSHIEAVLAEVLKVKDYGLQLREVQALGQSAVPKLRKVLFDQSRRWEQRWFCAMALAKIGGDESLAAVRSAMSDPLFLVRLAAVKAAVLARDRSALPLIRKLASSDEAMVVRSAAVDALAAFGDRGAASRLAGMLFDRINFYNNNSLPVRRRIVVALGVLGGVAEVPALIRELKRGDVATQKDVLAALELIAGRNSFNTSPPVSGGREEWVAWWSRECVAAGRKDCVSSSTRESGTASKAAKSGGSGLSD